MDSIDFRETLNVVSVKSGQAVGRFEVDIKKEKHNEAWTVDLFCLSRLIYSGTDNELEILHQILHTSYLADSEGHKYARFSIHGKGDGLGDLKETTSNFEIISLVELKDENDRNMIAVLNEELKEYSQATHSKLYKSTLMTRLEDGTLEIKLTCYDNGTDHNGAESLTMLKKEEADNFLSDGASLLLMRFLVRTNFKGHLRYMTFDNVLGLCNVNYFAAGEVSLSEDDSDEEGDNISIGNVSIQGDGVHSKNGSVTRISGRRAVRLVKIGRELRKNEDVVDRWMFYLFKNGRIYSWMHMNSPVYMEGTSDAHQHGQESGYDRKNQPAVEVSKANEAMRDEVSLKLENSTDMKPNGDELKQDQQHGIARDDTLDIAPIAQVEHTETVESELGNHHPLEEHNFVHSPILTMKEFLNESQTINDQNRGQNKIAEEVHEMHNNVKLEEHGNLKNSTAVEPYPEDEPVAHGRLADLHIPSTITEEDEKSAVDPTADIQEHKERSLDSIAEDHEFPEEPNKDADEEVEQVPLRAKIEERRKVEPMDEHTEPNHSLKLLESLENLQNIAKESISEEKLHQPDFARVQEEPLREHHEQLETSRSNEDPVELSDQTNTHSEAKMHDAPIPDDHERLSNLNRRRFKRLKNSVGESNSNIFNKSNIPADGIIDESTQIECQTYLVDHPELRELMTEFLQTLFIAKPKNVINFAAKYFQYISDISRLAEDRDK